MTGIRLSHTTVRDPRQAIREFHAGVAQPDMTMVVFFCSNDYDREALASEIGRLFAGVPVIGCTTAGEVGPAGYTEHSLSGASFNADTCTPVTSYIERLQQLQPSEAEAFGRTLLQELAEKAPQANPHNSFGLLLIDGLSSREEPVVRALQNSFGEMSLVGGSAADGLSFGKTWVYIDGTFRSDVAAVTLITTPLPFTVFKTQHFVPTEQRMVITEADPAHRVVREINGLPAAEEYARLLGVDVSDLNPKRYAECPVVVLIDGNNYVRSIQKANADGSVTFFCAIEEGVVLRVARGVDLIQNLEQAFADVRNAIGPPQAVLGFDCILRRLEIFQDHLEDRVAEVLRENNVVGFNTYGEQFRGMHVNQTLTGVAFGCLPGERHAD